MLIDPLTITRDSQDDWQRNIVSLRVSEHLWDDLSDSAEVQDAIAELEAAYKPYREPEPILSRPFEEADIIAPIADVIDYPFEHPAESRFSTGRFGVWYGADSLETSIRETAYHWLQDELAISPEERTERIVSIDRRVHRVACAASLVDLRPHVADNPALVSDNYATCQRLGADLHDSRQPGLITESARNRGADVVAVFRRDALSNVRNVCYLTYELNLDTGTITVERERGKTLLTI